MRFLGVTATLLLSLACSSSASKQTVTQPADAGDQGGGSGTGGGAGSGGASSSGGSAGEIGNDAGDGGDGSVPTGPLVFDPVGVELRAGDVAEATLRFQPEPGFQGTIEITLGLEGAAADASLSLSQTTFLFSESHTEEPFEVSALATAAQGAFVVQASATTADGELGASLPVAVIGRPGELDTTFGNGGFVDYQPEGNCLAHAVVPLADGRFVIVGQAITTKLMLARFLDDGSIDDSFGPEQNGRLVTARDASRMSAALVSGDAVLVAFDHNNIVNLLRVLAEGTADSDWGVSGFVQTDISPGNNVPLAVDAEGSILVGGDYFVEGANISQGAVRRLGSDGVVDDTFAGDGRAEISIGGLTFPEGSGGLEALTTQANGNITAVGGYYVPVTGPEEGDHAIALRLQPNGLPDMTFASVGHLLTKYGGGGGGDYQSARALVIQASGANAGKAVVAGYYLNPQGAYVLTLMRHGSNGTLDATFLGAGEATHDLPGNPEDTPSQMLLEPDDGLLVQIESGSATHFVVARFQADGALDTAWGEGGLVTPVPGRAYGMAVSGRHLLVVGSAQGSPDPIQSARIARYWLR